jgi:uncharacterized membrane protein
MNRYLSIDTLRGLIMIIMAIDHAIGAFADGHPPEINLPGTKESIITSFPGYSSETSQWSRLITHVCAPGFQLLAGMGMALSVVRSRQRGVSEYLITKDLLIRGLVLILMDWTLMAPIYWAPFLFLVLCCIGTCTLCFAYLRFLPRMLIGLLALAIIGLAPWYAPYAVIMDASAIDYPVNIWKNIVFNSNNWFNIMYPVLPWLGIFALGWFVGLNIEEAKEPSQFNKLTILLIVTGIASVVVALYLRASGSLYAERIPLGDATILDRKFWQFAKYPPSLVFMMLTVGVLLFMLGVLRYLDRRDTAPIWAKVVSVYGRTALFFFIAHFWVLGLAALACGFIPGEQYEHRFSFAVAYGAWFGVLVLLWPVCYAYDKLRQRHRTVLRYF